MTAYLTIVLGSALGGAGRYWITVGVTGRLGDDFPWGTLVVNALGSLLVGVITTGMLAWDGLPTEARLGLAVGFCGSFTTVSAFSLQTLALLRARRRVQAATNIAGTIALCLLMVWMGAALGGLLRGEY